MYWWVAVTTCNKQYTVDVTGCRLWKFQAAGQPKNTTNYFLLGAGRKLFYCFHMSCTDLAYSLGKISLTVSYLIISLFFQFLSKKLTAQFWGVCNSSYSDFSPILSVHNHSRFQCGSAYFSKEEKRDAEASFCWKFIVISRMCLYETWQGWGGPDCHTRE